MTKLLGVLCALLIAATASAANPRVEMVTSQGSVEIELEPDKAPKTVDNFLRYVRDGFYDGTIFHRVIAGFMIQGGGYTSDYKQKSTRDPIENEAANGLRNKVGTIAMARTANPHSATAQFFINVDNNKFLDHSAPTVRGYGYTVFGRVVKGMDVVNKIAITATGRGGPFASDVPLEPVIIKSIRIVEGAQ